MKDITFYSITPLFSFQLEPKTSVFSFAGIYKESRFEIKLVKPTQGPKFFDELMPWADEKTRKSCKHISFPPSMIIVGPATSYLTVDVTHEYKDELRVASNTLECVRIGPSILNALRLISSRGLLEYGSYYFSSTKRSSRFYTSSVIAQFPFSHLGHGSSRLREADFPTCQSLFETLLHKLHNSGRKSDKLLELALQYHKVAFNLEKVEHCFLILMIIFESMFKKSSEGNISKAAKRIGEKLGHTRAEKDSIRKDFDSNSANTFGKLRNSIAHGDSRLDLQIVIDKYPTLYGYVTRAIRVYIDSL